MRPIHPKYLSLAKLLDGRLFQIPAYQRAYSWTSRQREDLFGDITKVRDESRGEGHFMSAVVCLRRANQRVGASTFGVLEVVDGQQRLTTLILLLAAIKFSADETRKAEANIRRELGNLLVKGKSDELLLRTNHDKNHLYEEFLRYGHSIPASQGKTVADRELLLAIEECQEFVSEWKDSGATLPTLVSLLKNRLFFLLHEIEDEKTVYTVFEVLNSRGLDVSRIDRLKSILMGNAYALTDTNHDGIISDLNSTWREIYSTIGLRQGMNSESLRFAATLYADQAPSKLIGEQAAVDDFRRLAVDAKGIGSVSRHLLRVVKANDTILSNKRITAVSQIVQARLLAAAIHLRQDLASADRKTLLSSWEKITFRIYGMCGEDSRKKVTDYVQLAWSITNEDLTVDEIRDGIIEIGKEYTIERAIRSLRATNCYTGWETELRYLMYRYEEHLVQEQQLNFTNAQWEKIWMAKPAESIEHIWPQSTAPGEHGHRLGNLVLLPPKLNSKLQASDPVLKAESYRRTGLLIAGRVADTIESDGWKIRSIEAREKELLNWARTEWSD